MSSEGAPSVNHIPPIVIYDPVLKTARYATGDVLTNSTPQHVAIVDGDGTQIASFAGSGIDIPDYDYVAMTIAPDTTETYVFKTGGSTGTTVATVVVVYTDATRSDLSTVTRT